MVLLTTTEDTLAHYWTRWKKLLPGNFTFTNHDTPTYQVTLPSYPTRETKVQIGMA